MYPPRTTLRRPVDAAVSVPVDGDWRGGVGVDQGAERASPTDTNQSGGSWVMFVNTHWGLILCTLYMLRTLYVLSVLSAVARMSPPPLLSPPLSTLPLSQGLWWKCCSCLSQCVYLFLLICTLYSPRTFTLLSPGIHILRLLNLTAVPLLLFLLLTSPFLCSLLSTSSLHYRLWSAVTLCIMVLHSIWTVSLRLRPLADGLQWHFV